LSTGGTARPAKRSLTGIYQQFRQQIHEGAKFGIVGLAGVVIVIAGADILHFELGLGKYTSLTAATVVATVFSFLGNRYWSFRHRQGSGARHETIMFFVLNAVGLLIQYACLGLVTDVAGLSSRLWYTVANLIGIGLGTLFRFWSYRKWIWVPPEVHLARLRRGRHRKGRATSIPDADPAAAASAVSAPAMPAEASPAQVVQLPVRQPRQTQLNQVD
jgi:putative flippase GtrA